MFRLLVLLLLSLQGALCLPKPLPAQDIEDRWCIGKLIIGHCLPRPAPIVNVNELNVQMNADGTFVNAHDATISATTGLSLNNQHRITVNFAQGFTPAAHSEVHIQIEVNSRIYNDPTRNYIDVADG
ncbi:hypothetical protein CKM354_000446300 [Cercospora kikuchii]|uniref:Uncharacterized protein n=1 Tax=Cercospora kikuchii TaxID=84275 RepID=A0A9P3FBI4_9PEZI|nr:uncharacterized protein CKM354_000446300 [Cercospora kikuchii]GIZ41148.1 hypothetical protein CKM354_000446300 [Cercospora kikuchii]